MVCEGVSLQYSVRPSGDQARPLAVATPSSMRRTVGASGPPWSRPRRSMQYSAATGWRGPWAGSCTVPTHRRPSASHLPSLARSVAGSMGKCAIVRSGPPQRGAWQMRSRSATTRPAGVPPWRAGAMQPGSAGRGQHCASLPCAPLRHSARPAMSTQYRRDSRGCQKGDSPSCAGAAARGVQAVFMQALLAPGLRAAQRKGPPRAGPNTGQGVTRL